MPNTRRPAMSIPLRPNRSDRLPEVNSSAANTRLYASTTHWSCAVVAPSSRVTDLKNGLPGIAPNLLSSRLKELEYAELISREDAPPPIATTIYTLTPNGLALEPVLKALGLWGLRYMAVERQEDSVQAHWLA